MSLPWMSITLPLGCPLTVNMSARLKPWARKTSGKIAERRDIYATIPWWLLDVKEATLGGSDFGLVSADTLYYWSAWARTSWTGRSSVPSLNLEHTSRLQNCQPVLVLLRLRTWDGEQGSLTHDTLERLMDRVMLCQAAVGSREGEELQGEEERWGGIGLGARNKSQGRGWGACAKIKKAGRQYAFGKGNMAIYRRRHCIPRETIS